MTAILFGSISTLADTSELQRRAFNDAFAAHDLDWNWGREDYASMLSSNGGASRIADYASSRGQDVDSDAVHSTKSELFRKLLDTDDLQPRPGVLETLTYARKQGFKTGLVTTTSAENVAALLKALGSEIADAFDVVVDSTHVETPKPSPAAYLFALDNLGEDAQNSIAIEDNVGGVEAASRASVRCVAFPNENTQGGDFAAAVDTVDQLDAATIGTLATARS
jgi:HAD superfamily hydrolase (TIGR01509 family)